MKKILQNIYVAMVFMACHDVNSHEIDNSKTDSTLPSITAPSTSSKTSQSSISAIDLSHIKPMPYFGNDSVTVKIKSISLSDQFIFDRYEDQWHYFDAERGTKIVAISTSITSKIKDPALPPIAAYTLESNGFLKLVGVLDYRFYRWQNYGTYLGNYADYDNDFAHVATIPFGAFKQIDDSDLQKPIYIVGQKAGCFERNEDRLQEPAVQYLGGCNIKDGLAGIDFQQDYVLLKIFTNRKSSK
jgi:hypothetical protein